MRILGLSCFVTLAFCKLSDECEDSAMLQVAKAQGQVPKAPCSAKYVIPAWLNTSCGHTGGMWSQNAAELPLYLEGLTEEEIATLDNSQHFCPDVRGNQDTEQVDVMGGCLNGDPYVSCTYVYNSKVAGSVIQQKATMAGAPGLYAERLLLRYDDPLYYYQSGDLKAGNPPMNPFININQLWEKSDHAVWAGQCPVMEGELGSPVPTVCQFLALLQQKKVAMLVSTAPSQKEVRDGLIKQKCADYIMGMLQAADQAQGQICSGMPYSVDEIPTPAWSWSIGNKTARIFKRKVTFGSFSFTQLYFNAWPDAFGEATPAVPIVDAVKILIQEASQEQRVVSQDAGGRGRAGTMAVAIASTWQQGSDSVSTSTLVENTLQFRERRADIVEHYSQLELLGVVFNLSSPNALPLNQKIG